MNRIPAALTTLGIVATLLGIPSLAQAHSTTAITAPMGSVDAYNEGVYQAQQGNYSQAIASWTQAIAFNPKFPEAYYNRGLAYLMRGTPKPRSQTLTVRLKLILRMPRHTISVA